ncbi:MAG: hypothetical protein P0Y51_19810 [Candidatus Pseudomonas colombiensis]|nr:MAG: hypothetical protein P0Y51_19810 [Pseudomonas sp.]
MSELDRYLLAATRDNTRRSYRAAIEHFEVAWGGFLPATSEAVARYLAAYAGELSINTLKLRLSALAQWHNSQGFPDPTKAPVVRQVFKGIRALHPAQEKQAEPLQLQDLEQVIAWLEQEAQTAIAEGNQADLLRARRDSALILLGFWRGFRSDELCRLQVEHVQAVAGSGISLYLPRSKGDRDNLGKTYQTPALQRLCPVQAYIDWLGVAALVRGPVFRGIDRWGHLGEEGLHANSVIPLLRQALERGRHSRRALHQPLIAPRLCHLGSPQRLGLEIADELRRLEGHEVGHALHRGQPLYGHGADQRKARRAGAKGFFY